MSTATVYPLCTQGKLPNLRVSNSLRIALKDVEATLWRKNRQ